MAAFNLRRSLVRLLFRDEFAMLREGVAAAADARHWVMAAQAGGASTSPARLGEADNQYVDLILQQMGYTPIGGAPGFQSLERMFDERARQQAVIDSRRMYQLDVLTARAVDMWTDFGFGQHVTVTPGDPALALVFDQFWTAPRNRPILGDAVIHENSQHLLTDGEFFWAVWVSMLDGACTLRRLATEQIRDIVVDPDDPDTPVYYVQPTPDGDVYYSDWRASDDTQAHVPPPERATPAAAQRPLTRAVIIPAQRNRIGKRGWPQVRQALIWARAYRDFIGDRATVAKKAAMYVEKVTAKGTNQRGVDNIIARLESSLAQTGLAGDRNANTTAGQTWVQNEQVDREWMSRDTGASAAQIDGLTIAGQAAAGFGVPLNWLGRPDAMQNRAVAKESSLPWYEQVQRYQTFWGATFSDLVEVVGRMHNQYGGGQVTDFTAEVSLDSPFQNDVDEVVALLGSLNATGLDAGAKAKAGRKLVGLALKSLGIRDVDALLEPEPVLNAPGTAPVLPVVEPDTGPSPLVRAALALERATDALEREPAATQPVTIVAGAEGATMLQPPVVHNHIDLSALTRAIESLPGATDLRPLLEAIAARPNVVENHVDLGALAEAVEAQQVDVPALIAQLVTALQAMPAPVVNVQPVIEAPTRETASFKFSYDGAGRIVGASKSAETEPV